MSRTPQPQNNHPDKDSAQSEDRADDAGRKPRDGEIPLSETLTGHPDAGGLAGQGGMSDAD